MITKSIENIYYRFRTALMFNHGIDHTYDILLSKCLESGVESVERLGGYNTSVVFGNGLKAYLWTANKWFAYLNEGYIGSFAVNNMRPKAKTMYLFSMALVEFELSQAVKSVESKH